MYPLVLIFAAGLFPFDKKVLKYSFPLAFTGWTVAVYHNLLYYKIIPESAAPCVQGISCTTTFIQWFGFVTIPFLSLLSFTIILACLAVIYKETRK